MSRKLIILYIVSLCFSQEVFTEYLLMDGDTVDVFSYQIPESYDGSSACALLVAFHQWGGSESSTYTTTFDEEANSRGWIFMSPYGGSSNNYNHQGAQGMVKHEILWMMENYSIDSDRIYMVGGSMGGAAGMIYANNHLDPSGPMVAATASGSGILDCERRAIEMDGNNSMIEWFGGDWHEVPFEYHRNSAIYFADSTQSMHTNLQYTPLYFDFGVSEPHRTHAEEMYEIMLGLNQSMWIDTEPTGSHGFSVMDEQHVCDWLSGFSLITDPDSLILNLDEPGRAYWIESRNQIDDLGFISIEVNRDQGALSVYNFENSDSLVLHILNQNFENYEISSSVSINKLGLSGDLLDSNDFTFQMISDEGLELDYTFEDGVLWLEHYGLPPYELPFYGSFNLNFEGTESLPGDVNQDGACDILDIILMINHIMDITTLDDGQFGIADMNQDGFIDIMDIILVLNLIINL